MPHSSNSARSFVVSTLSAFSHVAGKVLAP